MKRQTCCEPFELHELQYKVKVLAGSNQQVTKEKKRHQHYDQCEPHQVLRMTHVCIFFLC